MINSAIVDNGLGNEYTTSQYVRNVWSIFATSVGHYLFDNCRKQLLYSISSQHIDGVYYSVPYALSVQSLNKISMFMTDQKCYASYVCVCVHFVDYRHHHVIVSILFTIDELMVKKDFDMQVYKLKIFVMIYI